MGRHNHQRSMMIATRAPQSWALPSRHCPLTSVHGQRLGATVCPDNKCGLHQFLRVVWHHATCITMADAYTEHDSRTCCLLCAAAPAGRNGAWSEAWSLQSRFAAVGHGSCSTGCTARYEWLVLYALFFAKFCPLMLPSPAAAAPCQALQARQRAAAQQWRPPSLPPLP